MLNKDFRVGSVVKATKANGLPDVLPDYIGRVVRLRSDVTYPIEVYWYTPSFKYCLKSPMLAEEIEEVFDESLIALFCLATLGEQCL